MTLSNVTNGSADSCAFIVARQLERLKWQGRAGAVDSVSAVLARGLRAVIPLFFYAAEIAAAKMLLFFRESVATDILT